MSGRKLKEYRWPGNPLEKRLALAWRAQQGSRCLLEWILGDGQNMVAPSDEERVAAEMVIQWLGSHVGQHFLANALGVDGLEALKSRVDGAPKWTSR